jgi:hypothetical protein
VFKAAATGNQVVATFDEKAGRTLAAEGFADVVILPLRTPRHKENRMLKFTPHQQALILNARRRWDMMQRNMAAQHGLQSMTQTAVHCV